MLRFFPAPENTAPWRRLEGHAVKEHGARDTLGAQESYRSHELVESGPSVQILAPIQSNEAKEFGRDRSYFGRIPPEFGSKPTQIWSRSTKVGEDRPNLDKFGPNLDEFGPSLTDCGTCLTDIGANLGDFGTN